MFVSFLSRNTTYKFLKSVCLHLEVFVYPNASPGLNHWFYLLLAGAVLQHLELQISRHCWKLINILDTALGNCFTFSGCNTMVSLAKQDKDHKQEERATGVAV